MVSRFPSNQEISIGTSYKMIIHKKLGSGAFGEVYKGFNIKTNEGVAIKMESAKNRHPLLRYETGVLRYLQGGAGIPIVYDFIPSLIHNIMIFELLGPSLEVLFDYYCDRKFSLKTILILADQMLSRIEFLHMRHVIHRDIKPDNFLIGIEKKKNQVYIIDFGLAKRFRDPKTGLHIEYKDGKSLTGTARYASIYTHLGIEQSRRDDLESLAYSLIYFNNGMLPWQGTKGKSKNSKYQKILEKKVNIQIEDLCKDLPEEFGLFLKYVRELQFEEKPEYAYLKSLISRMYGKNNYEYDMMLDWLLLNEPQGSSQNEEQWEQQEEENKIIRENSNNNNQMEINAKNDNNKMIIDKEDNYEKERNNNNEYNNSQGSKYIIKKSLDTNDLITE